MWVMCHIMKLVVIIYIKKKDISGQNVVAGHDIVEKYSKVGSVALLSRVEMMHSGRHQISAGLVF